MSWELCMSISQQIRMISIRPSFVGPGGIGETYPLLKLEVTPRRWTARGMMGMCISSSLSVRFLFYVRSLTAWLDSDDHVGGNMDLKASPRDVAPRTRDGCFGHQRRTIHGRLLLVG